MLNFITGGVCAAQGFRAGGIHVGVKTHAAWKKDVALIVSDEDCACAAVYTKNAVKAAHIHVDKRHLADGKARAAVINSGNANACAPHGEENAERVCAAAAKAGVSDITQKKDALRFTLAVFRPEALVQVCGLTKYKFRLTLSAGETPMLTLKLKPGADVLETALELVEDLKLATQALEKA